MSRLVSYVMVTAISLGFAFYVATLAGNAISESFNQSSAMIASH